MSLAVHTRRPTVLVVDDDPNLVELIAAILEEHGYSVDTASSGTEALQKLQDLARAAMPWKPLPLDVIILDVIMPGTDGFQVCQRIKQDSLFKYIPIIILTALSSPGDKVAAVACGADGYITKPFLPEELAASVKAKLQIKQREEALLRSNSELAAVDAASAAAARTLDPQHVLNGSLAALIEHVNPSAAAIYLLDEAARLLRRAAQWGTSRPETQPLDEGATARALHALHPVLETNLDGNPDLPSMTLEGNSLGSWVGIPLRGTERSLGVLEIYYSPAHSLERPGLGFHETIGERIGIALQNAEHHQRLRELLAELVIGQEGQVR